MLDSTEKIRRLERALAYGGTHRVSDMVELARGGKVQFHELRDACIVTEITSFPLVRTVNFWTISGNLKDIVELEPGICAWAVEHGCTVATASGRPGWGKVGAPLGWKIHWPSFIKPLVGTDQ